MWIIYVRASAPRGERRVTECIVWVLQLAEYHLLNKLASQSARTDQIVAAASAAFFLSCWLMNDIRFVDVSEWDDERIL